MTVMTNNASIPAVPAAMGAAHAPAPGDAATGAADPLALVRLQSELYNLSAKAYELEEARRQLMEVGGDEALAQAYDAQAQAGFIRGTVDRINCEIAQAPTTANGQKILPNNRVHALLHTIGVVNLRADAEIHQVANALADASVPHGEKKSLLTKISNSVVECISPIPRSVRAASAAAAATASMASTASARHQVASTGAEGWLQRVRASASETVTHVTEGARSLWSDARSSLNRGVAAIRESSIVQSAMAAGASLQLFIVGFVDESLETTQRSFLAVNNYIQETAAYRAIETHALAPVKRTAKAGYQAIAEKLSDAELTAKYALAEGKKTLTETMDSLQASYKEKKEWVAGLLRSDDVAPTKLAKKEHAPSTAAARAPATAKANASGDMNSALKRAASLLPALPTLNTKTVTDWFDISMPSFPKMDGLFRHIPSLY